MASATKDFRDIPASDSLAINKFISDKLQPDDSFNCPIHKALDSLCRTLENELPDVNRIIKGGSMGKGTALKGKSDLDCVMILNEVKNVEELKRKISTLQQKLIRILEGNTLSGWNISVKRTTPFCVQFTMKSSTTTVEVDLLPTFDKNKLGLNELYRQMKTKDKNTRLYYSAALTELQRDFVKDKPARLKDLIRLVKYWSKKCVVPVGANPTSFPLELITISAWEEAGKPDSFDIAVGFRAVMEKLRFHQRLDIVWYDNYDQNKVDAKRHTLLEEVSVGPMEPPVHQPLAQPEMRGIIVHSGNRQE